VIGLLRFGLTSIKRRVVDDDYLSNLHRDNMLLTNDPISHIEEDGVVTGSGKRYHAEAIIMCNGFKPGLDVMPFRLIGKNGLTLEEHFKEFGGIGAYKTCAFHGFPNFFLTVGRFLGIWVCQFGIDVVEKVQTP